MHEASKQRHPNSPGPLALGQVGVFGGNGCLPVSFRGAHLLEPPAQLVVSCDDFI